MFCHIFGTKTIEGALFCKKCGAKLINSDFLSQDAELPLLVDSPQTARVVPQSPVDGSEHTQGVAESKEEPGIKLFDVELTSTGTDKIAAIKVLRELTGLGLKEAKDIVDSVPQIVKTSLPETEAESIKAKFTRVGATVTLKDHDIAGITDSDVGVTQSTDASDAESSANVKDQIEYANHLLERGDFNGAGLIADRLLDLEPANVEAYFLKILVNHRAASFDELMKMKPDLEHDPDFIKALREVDEEDRNGLLNFARTLKVTDEQGNIKMKLRNIPDFIRLAKGVSGDTKEPSQQGLSKDFKELRSVVGSVVWSIVSLILYAFNEGRIWYWLAIIGLVFGVCSYAWHLFKFVRLYQKEKNVNHNGVELKDRSALHKRAILNGFGGVVLVILIITSAVVFSKVQNNASDVASNILSATIYSKEINMVKNGTLSSYPSKTVGKAFDNFLSNAKWTAGESDTGQKFVNVSGGVLYAGKEVNIVFQFFVDVDKSTFSYNACEINGVPQSNLIVQGFFDKIFQ